METATRETATRGSISTGSAVIGQDIQQYRMQECQREMESPSILDMQTHGLLDDRLMPRKTNHPYKSQPVLVGVI